MMPLIFWLYTIHLLLLLITEIWKFSFIMPYQSVRPEYVEQNLQGNQRVSICVRSTFCLSSRTIAGTLMISHTHLTPAMFNVLSLHLTGIVIHFSSELLSRWNAISDEFLGYGLQSKIPHQFNCYCFQGFSSLYSKCGKVHKMQK